MVADVIAALMIAAAAQAVIANDANVRVEEPPPHGAIGMGSAWRYFDTVPGRAMEFRKRALHKGAAIGVHRIDHDEVYYVLSGRGLVTASGKSSEVGAGAAIYIFAGDEVGIAQKGADDLVLIISYPLAPKPGH